MFVSQTFKRIKKLLAIKNGKKEIEVDDYEETLELSMWKAALLALKPRISQLTTLVREKEEIDKRLRDNVKTIRLKQSECRDLEYRLTLIVDQIKETQDIVEELGHHQAEDADSEAEEDPTAATSAGSQHGSARPLQETPGRAPRPWRASSREARAPTPTGEPARHNQNSTAAARTTRSPCSTTSAPRSLPSKATPQRSGTPSTLEDVHMGTLQNHENTRAQAEEHNRRASIEAREKCLHEEQLALQQKMTQEEQRLKLRADQVQQEMDRLKAEEHRLNERAYTLDTMAAAAAAAQQGLPDQHIKLREADQLQRAREVRLLQEGHRLQNLAKTHSEHDKALKQREQEQKQREQDLANKARELQASAQQLQTQAQAQRLAEDPQRLAHLEHHLKEQANAQRAKEEELSYKTDQLNSQREAMIRDFQQRVKQLESKDSELQAQMQAAERARQHQTSELENKRVELQQQQRRLSEESQRLHKEAVILREHASADAVLLAECGIGGSEAPDFIIQEKAKELLHQKNQLAELRAQVLREAQSVEDMKARAQADKEEIAKHRETAQELQRNLDQENADFRMKMERQGQEKRQEMEALDTLEQHIAKRKASQDQKLEELRQQDLYMDNVLIQLNNRKDQLTTAHHQLQQQHDLAQTLRQTLLQVGVGNNGVENATIPVNPPHPLQSDTQPPPSTGEGPTADHSGNNDVIGGPPPTTAKARAAEPQETAGDIDEVSRMLDAALHNANNPTPAREALQRRPPTADTTAAHSGARSQTSEQSPGQILGEKSEPPTQLGSPTSAVPSITPTVPFQPGDHALIDLCSPRFDPVPNAAEQQGHHSGADWYTMDENDILRDKTIRANEAPRPRVTGKHEHSDSDSADISDDHSLGIALAAASAYAEASMAATQAAARVHLPDADGSIETDSDHDLGFSSGTGAPPPLKLPRDRATDAFPQARRARSRAPSTSKPPGGSATTAQ